MVGCSIGLAHKKVPVVGVIMMPFMNQLVRSEGILNPPAYLQTKLVLRSERRRRLVERKDPSASDGSTAAVGFSAGMCCLHGM